MLAVNHLTGFGVGGSGPVTLSYTGSVYNSAGTSVFTFNNVPFGEEAGDRRILVALGTTEASGSLAYVTIGGVSATVLVQQTSSNNIACMAMALVPTGTTGTVVLGLSGSTGEGAYCGAWRTTGLPANVAYATNKAAGTNYITVDTYSGGLVAAYAYVEAGTGVGWIGLTERWDAVGGNGIRSSGADASATGTIFDVLMVPSGSFVDRILMAVSI